LIFDLSLVEESWGGEGSTFLQWEISGSAAALLPLVGVIVIGLKGSVSEVADKSIWKYNNWCAWVEIMQRRLKGSKSWNWYALKTYGWNNNIILGQIIREQLLNISKKKHNKNMLYRMLM
jgi:hypothetical protein